MSRDGAHLSSLDLPVSYIGRSVARPNALRLLEIAGRTIDKPISVFMPLNGRRWALPKPLAQSAT